MSLLTREYKRVIFIPLTCNINAYVVCIGSYRFPLTIGTNIVPFTLEQNNFMAKHILQFPKHLFLIQLPSLYTSALSLSLSNTDFPTFTFFFFLDFRGILVIFRFHGYFGHFLSFRDILVIFWVLGVFWSFLRFRGYFGQF